MDLSQLNYWAIGVAALSTFLIGGIWYSPIMFAKGWMKENSLTEDDLKGGNPAVIYGGAFVAALIMAFNLAAFLGPESDLAWGATAGALAGLGWVAMALGTIYLFERRSFKLFLINGGYQVVAFVVMGAIIGAWH